jgi:TRAP-type C4-dicarboxylate transport system substrate-binding protein
MEEKYMRKLIFGALIAGLAVLPAKAETNLRVSSAFGPNHVNADGYQVFLDKLEDLTAGSFKGRDFPSGLVSPGEMVSALASGIVDVGSVLMPYFPAEFNDANLPSEMALIGQNGLVMSAAATEYIATCPECLAEFSQLNEAFLAGSATPTYQLLSTTPIRDLESLKGVRVRTGGSAFTRWVEAMGAIPVQLPAPEVFEALNQGVVAAHYNTPQDLKSYNLYDMIKSITLINVGTFNGVSPFSMRLDLWNSLTAEERHAFVEAAQYGAATVNFRFEEEVQAALKKAKADGIEIIEPSDGLAKASSEFIQEDLKQLVASLDEKGISPAAQKMARFQELVQKWTGLVEGVETRDAYAQLLMAEIWDKIDLASYPN